MKLVTARSGQRPAVILGDLGAGRRRAVGNQVVLYGRGEAALDLLEATLTPAVASDFTPLCTYCATNPMVGGEESFWLDHIYLHNTAATAVVATERTFEKLVVPVEGGTLVPLSPHYGLRSRIAF